MSDMTDETGRPQIEVIHDQSDEAIFLRMVGQPDGYYLMREDVSDLSMGEAAAQAKVIASVIESGHDYDNLLASAKVMNDKVKETFIVLAAPLDQLDQDAMYKLRDELREVYAAFQSHLERKGE